MTPDGVGDLYVAFEQLKEKLLQEGLFDQRHKKPLPRYPKTIAVITSSAGAAVQDIIRVLASRWPMTKVAVLPVRVQGVEAPPEIVEALRYVNINKIADLIITGRGGGSIEDLWAFNDERVARAIFTSEIPVISAVGHEPDVTIADFVADVRAATPSNAAEIAVPDKLEVFNQIKAADIRMQQAINRDIKTRRHRLSNISDKRVLQSPKYYIDDRRIQIDRHSERLLSTMQGQIYIKRERYARLAASLDAMSPLKVLRRGYAIARRTDGRVIKNAGDVKTGDRIIVRLKQDEVSCIAE
jgi:exodeoxyribonuclease VII large subunit